MKNRIHFTRVIQQLFLWVFMTSLAGITGHANAQYFSSPSTSQQPRSSSSTYSTPAYGSNDSYNTTPNSRQTSGYTKQNGTVVSPYYSTTPDNTNLNNYSTQGNTNPYTGSTGTRARDYSSEATNYGQGRTIQTGPRGGQYYVNDSGNKVYVPKQRSPF